MRVVDRESDDGPYGGLKQKRIHISCVSLTLPSSNVEPYIIFCKSRLAFPGARRLPTAKVKLDPMSCSAIYQAPQ